MKRFVLLFGVLGGLLFMLPSCDKCKDVDCVYGTCEKGVCECEAGYTGSRCQTSLYGTSSGGSSSGGSSSGGSSSGGGGYCTNTCTYANDGACDDGGAGSDFDICDYGTDCADCGTRYGSSSSSSSSSGGSSSSSSSSSGSSYGQVTFYTQTDYTCGDIAVTVTNYATKYITVYYSNGISDCGASGCATYTLSPGTYSYSASCDGYNWGPASFTISSNGCLKYELY